MPFDMSERNLKAKILDLLETNHLLSATSILEQLLKLGTPYNKTSVYRALDQLEASNAICQHHLIGDESLYELAHHEHAHLICRNCGTIESSELPELPPGYAPSFHIEHQHLTLLGLCSSCRKRNYVT